MEIRSDKCREQGHWFEFVDYVPDFENRCYMLKARCEECKYEILEKVKEGQKANQEYYSNHFSSENRDRYWKKPIELCISTVVQGVNPRGIGVEI